MQMIMIYVNLWRNTFESIDFAIFLYNLRHFVHSSSVSCKNALPMLNYLNSGPEFLDILDIIL